MKAGEYKAHHILFGDMQPGVAKNIIIYHEYGAKVTKKGVISVFRDFNLKLGLQ